MERSSKLTIIDTNFQAVSTRMSTYQGVENPQHIADFLDAQKAHECFERHGIKVDVPISYLAGRKEPLQYSRRQQKTVRNFISNQGKQFLNENPIWAVLVPSESFSSLVIIDGHNRARFSPAFKIHRIPTIVVDVATLANYWNMQPTQLAERFDKQTNLALAAFMKKSHKVGRPQNLPREIAASNLLTFFNGGESMGAKIPQAGQVYQRER